MTGSELRQGQAPWMNDIPTTPIALSIVGVIAWLVFILLYALYWSGGFSLFQNIIVTLASFLIAGLVIGLMWTPWFHLSGERR